MLKLNYLLNMSTKVNHLLEFYHFLFYSSFLSFGNKAPLLFFEIHAYVL